MKHTLFLLLAVAMALFSGVVSAAEPAVATQLAAFDLADLGFMGLAGMIVNKEALTSVFTALKTTFNKAFGSETGDWKQTAMLVTSTTSENSYKWFSRFPKMRLWIGEKKAKALEAFKYTIVNDDYEATVEVLRNDIEDDQLGGYTIQAQDAGQSAGELPDIIVADLKNNAFTEKCFDGQYFYDTDHEVADASVSNKITVALSAATLATAKASFGVAKTGISEFKDSEGQPLGLRANILEVPGALETTARMLLEGEKLEDGSPNPFRGTAKVLVNERLSSSTAWFLHVTNRAVKPFIYQQRKKPVFVSQTDMSADDVFERAIYKFGAEARASGGYGFWQLSYGSDGTT